MSNFSLSKSLLKGSVTIHCKPYVPSSVVAIRPFSLQMPTGSTSGEKVMGEKPVGSVCFAIAGPRPTKSVGKLFSGDRERIRRAAAFHALDMARRYFM